ncbi:MAG TPA: 3-ketoacyl-ACP reductase [Casimicrobiaceae bacterium]|nr:3-ketoacyl-ACP reductase [Casimicrobiaceae bacterium]
MPSGRGPAGRSAFALVTGARRGIGRGIAWALAEQGFDIVANDLVDDADTRAMMDGIASRGRRAAFLAHDVADVAGHATFVDRAFAAFGTIDCLVSNAGIQVKVRGDLLDVTPESFDEVVRVNLRGTFFLTQAVARRMLAQDRATSEPPRSLITISSTNARTVGPNHAEYCVAKSGLAMLNQLFAQRLATQDIMCYEIRPGIIRTGMTAGAFDRYDALIKDGVTPIRRWGEPADVGATVAALARRLLPFSTGDAFNVDGGLHMRVL